jgi:isopenicillin N synthase-like dioxygenase
VVAHRTARFPVISLGGADEAGGGPRAATARDLDRACRSVGVFAVVDHGLPADLVADAIEVSQRFFALPAAVKDRYRVECPAGVRRGYHGLGAEAQAAAAGRVTGRDRSETFCLGPLRDPAIDDPWAAADVWPDDDLPEMQAVLRRYRSAADLLARRLLRLAALVLRGDAYAFDGLVTQPLGGLRANHYPALASALPDGTWRAGPHTDYSLFTLLASDGRPGLEILVDGEWLPADVPAGALLVNVGDVLAQVSRGGWHSPWHRVGTLTGGGRIPARTTLAFFSYPNADAVVPGLWPGDAPGTAGDYLREKVSLLFGEAEPRRRPSSPSLSAQPG